jgi:type II secretory pathway pseudopilin PulG
MRLTMHRISSCRALAAGFTLIELMISIALSMTLLLTCFSGLRLVSQAVTASKRLAIENQALHAGVSMALEEVDFWSLADNPDDSTRQPLRGRETSGGYMPFTSFANTPDAVTNGAFIDTQPGFTEIPASPRGGWNPNPLAWAAWDPRTWTRANLPEESSTTESWGTFGIYENLDPRQSWHCWYDDQIRGLIDSLGFYGTYEYLPSNAFLVYHGSSVPIGAPATITWGGVPSALVTDGLWLCSRDGGDDNMKGRVRNSNGSRYFLPGPQAAASNLCRTWASVGYNGRDTNWSMATVTTFLNNSSAALDLLPNRPATWPDVSFEVHRFIERGHPVNACLVTLRSPLTGSSFVIPFTCTGTTLRGARQQRSPAAGWVADPYTDATLDYGTPP